MDKLQQIILPISRELDECRAIFRSAYSDDNPLLNTILDFVRKKEGKMMRPILTLLSAKLFGNIDSRAINVATAYEFFHTASLVHDDVVDESDERRGQPSVNSSFNNKRAVLVGDFILSKSLNCIAKANDSRLVDIVSVAAGQLANGELLQLTANGNYKTTDEYIRVITNKTAALFMACAQSGAIVGGASDEDIENMRQFGELVGISFQIKDDLLDEEIDKEFAVQMLDKYTQTALSLLDKYPDSDIRQSLLDYAKYVSSRNY